MKNKYYTGIDGALYVNGDRLIKIRSWSLTASAEALETTNLGSYAPTYRYGKNSFSGTATGFYYVNDVEELEIAPLLSTTIRTTQVSSSTTHTLLLYIDSDRSIEANVLITNSDISCSAADVMMVNISFVVTGFLSNASIGAA